MGEIDGHWKYSYDPNDIIIKCEIINPSDPNAGMIEQYYDSSGKFIKLRELDNEGRSVKEEITTAGKKVK